jgi:acetyl esterase/lipase
LFSGAELFGMAVRIAIMVTISRLARRFLAPIRPSASHVLTGHSGGGAALSVTASRPRPWLRWSFFGLAIAAIVYLGNVMLFSPVDYLNGLAAFANNRAASNVPYGTGPRNQLDIYRPRGGAERLPVAVMFYGGTWEEGDRATYRFVGAALASRGIVTVIPDYRVYPEVRFPDFLRDAAEAVRWTRDHIADYGGDPTEIVLIGHSAGAHIAAMLALDPQWLRNVGLDSSRDIRGMVGLAGPYDFLPLTDPKLKDIFGPADQRARTQPINFVDGKAAPIFVAAGTQDRTVDPGNTTRLARKIESRGGQVTDVLYPGVDHRTLIGAFSPLLRRRAPVLEDTVNFIHAVTQTKRPAADRNRRTDAKALERTETAK